MAMLLSVSFFWFFVFFECTTLCLLLCWSSFFATFKSPFLQLGHFLKPSNPHLHLFNFNASTYRSCPSSLSFSTFLLSSGLHVSCFLSSLFPYWIFSASLSFFFLIYFLFPTRNAVDLIISSFLPFLHLAIHLLPLILFFTSPSVSICSLYFFPCLFPPPWIPRSPHGEELFAASVSLLLIPPVFHSHTLNPTGFRFLSPSLHLHPPVSIPPITISFFPSTCLPSSFPYSHGSRW